MEDLIRKASIPPFAQIMDSTSYDFLHRITNLIFKSKAGMAYDKSIINIDINFDNEDQAIPKLPKPILPRKDRKDKIATIQPSAESRKTSAEIERRVQELQKFRRESQSAVEAPLLVTALVKKTNQRLDSIEERTYSQLSAFEKFVWAARVVHVLVSSCMRWRRYKKPDASSKGKGSAAQSAAARKGSQKSGAGIGFDSRTFKGKSKISEELRQILTSVPRARTNEGLKKVQRLCRSTRAFMIFPLEREVDLSRCVAYERYDNGRVIACQGRSPQRFYYVLSGRVSKVCMYDLAAGVTKMSFGELMQGNTTDPVELMNGIKREHSLICKGPVEVLVLDREDFMELMSTSPDSGLPIEILRSIELFRNFPLEKFFEEKDAIVTKYFAKDTVIVKDSNDTPYFYIVKSGRCKVVRKQDVLDMSKTTKLPSITTVTKTTPRSTPGKNPTSLLELSQCFCKQNSPRIYKQKSTEEKCNLADDARPKNIEKRSLEKTIDLKVDPVFFPFGEICARKVSKVQKRPSELSVSAPTRTALLQIALLKPGNMFGLESMMPKVTTKISSEADVVEENQDPSTKSLILISEGAECIMINKRFFLMNASITTLVQLKALREEYMTVPDARHRIQCLESWDLYKGELVKTLATRAAKQPRR
ncbi:unnamed protein product [Porites lobata]|uniref:Cyclic nucleotide-binding domain-containing protein n=1 Tax=Porites lobata TaxID=104759 RepID=A0ABN8RD68_9CNID|nr:unnamed protein product [Porites lobata]